MPRMPLRRLSARVAVAALVLAAPVALVAPPAQAAATDLFLSEYVEGSGNNKALEVFNGTAAPVDLAAGQYSVQMYFNGGPAAGLTIPLTGTVAPGDVHVLAQASASPTVLAQADQTNASGWFNGDDAVVLRKGTQMLDVVGQVGTDPGTEWGSGLTGTADNTLARLASVCAGDPDGSDPFDPAAQWTGAAVDTFTGLGSHTATCSGGGDPDPDPEPDPACAAAATAIGAVQGSGDTAATTGPVTVRGTVVGDYEGASPALRGFYLQDTGDGDPATSDGIFVFNAGADQVVLGDVVTVSGTAGEFQGQTQISSVTSLATCGTSSVAPVEVTLPVASATALERHEGMLVRMPQALSVTEHFQLGRFGQVVVSSGGRLQQPTNVVSPGAEANALQAANDLNRLIIDDALNNQNPDPIVFGRGGQPLSASNTLRGGDTVTGATGVLTYTWAGNSASGNAYRLRPIGALGGAAEFAAVNDRPTTPDEVGGTVRVAGMNLLNYFNTFDGLPDRVDNCRAGTLGAPVDCRGADTQAEFDRQWPKTVAEIVTLDAAVIGFNEIENDGFGPDSAIAHLVDRLNEATAPGTYALVDADAGTGRVDSLGDDAIKVGLVYQPGVVTPTGRTATLDTEAFVNGGDSGPRSRASLLQAFRVNDTGAVFLANVNHLKSKGSECDAPDAGDGQGNCNQVRTTAARELLRWLGTDPTGTGDPDVMLIGDYNAYAKEDPIRVLEDAGYTNLAPALLGEDAYSYVFDGQWGALDHALASASLRDQVTGVTDHHVNADEPSVLDYNTNFKSAGQLASLYAPDRYRMSDHDPVLVGLTPNAPPSATAAFEDPLVGCGTDNASLTVEVADPDAADTHEVTVAWGDGSSETVATSSDLATLTHTYAAAGRYTATVSVRDSEGNRAEPVSAVAAVAYDTAGFEGPLAGGTRTAKAGSTVPVKLQLADCDGSEPTDLAPEVTVTLGGEEVLTGTMSYVDGGWQYLLRTGALPDRSGSYTVTIEVPDTGQTHAAALRLRG